MAAAAVTYLQGGTMDQSFDAAAIAINNLMGLICDPVAGLVEVPCHKRNAMGAANALICTEMVMAGIPSIIPFDEVVIAMKQVGDLLPACHREQPLVVLLLQIRPNDTRLILWVEKETRT